VKTASKMAGAETMSVEVMELVDLSSSTPHDTTVTREESPAISVQRAYATRNREISLDG